MADKGTEARRRLQEADRCLARLSTIDEQYTADYFETQWERQRNIQKAFINERVQEKRDRLKILLRLEEDLHETRCVIAMHLWYNIFQRLIINVLPTRDELLALNARRVRTRTEEERRAVLSLPSQITHLETKIQAFAMELGTTEFLQLTGSTG